VYVYKLKYIRIICESIPDVKSIVALALAVWVEIRFKAPPDIELGKVVIALNELFTANFRAMRYLSFL
jgi:hypothetical protein